MNTKTAFATLSFVGLTIAATAQARPDLSSEESPETLFAKMDADRSLTISEAELVQAFHAREERRLERIAKLEEMGSPKAEGAQARFDSQREDPMIGSPAAAAAFIIANFDEDGDWALDRQEMQQAFSSIRKWRGGAAARAS